MPSASDSAGAYRNLEHGRSLDGQALRPRQVAHVEARAYAAVDVLGVRVGRRDGPAHFPGAVDGPARAARPAGPGQVVPPARSRGRSTEQRDRREVELHLGQSHPHPVIGQILISIARERDIAPIEASIEAARGVDRLGDLARVEAVAAEKFVGRAVSGRQPETRALIHLPGVFGVKSELPAAVVFPVATHVDTAL